MTDTTQPTPIDADLYERLKKYTKDKHGQTRGSLRDELEAAIKNHLEADNPTNSLARIENDVATIKAQLAEQDGGEVIPEGGAAPSPSTSDTHTHTEDAVDPEVEDEFDRLQAGHPANQDGERNDSDTQADDGDDSDTLSKPSGKASNKKKAAWLWEHKVPESPIVISPNAFVKWVDDAWGFGDRARDRLLRQVFDAKHAKGVKRDRSGTWQVVVAESKDARDDKIDDQFEDAAYVLQEDGEHVEGADVYDNLVLE